MILKFNQKSDVNCSKGFTLVEFLVALSIFVIFAILVTTFQKDIFSFNSFIQADLNAQMQGRRAVVTMVSEMREMSPSSLGTYPISTAATSSVTFFSDIDSDNLKEQIQYYIQGTKIQKSIIKPTGNPLVYNPGSAVVSTVVSNIANGTSTPLFEYYDTNYAGTSSPIALPISVSAIRLIKVQILLDRKASHASIPIVITSNATLRNLKDNI